MLEGLFLPIPGKSSGLLQSFILLWVSLHGKVINFLGTSITKSNPISGYSFDTGQFYFIWSVIWLFVRFCGLREQLILNIGYTAESFTTSVMYTFVLTLIMLIIAFIPTLLISRSFTVHQVIRLAHEWLWFRSRVWQFMTVSSHKVWSLILYNNWRIFGFVNSLIFVFIGMFFQPVFLFIWLPLIYWVAYLSRVILHVFTVMKPIRSQDEYTLLEVEYFDLAMVYFSREHSPSFYMGKKAKKKREFHTSCRRDMPTLELPEGDVVEGKPVQQRPRGVFAQIGKRTGFFDFGRRHGLYNRLTDGPYHRVTYNYRYSNLSYPNFPSNVKVNPFFSELTKGLGNDVIAFVPFGSSLRYALGSIPLSGWKIAGLGALAVYGVDRVVYDSVGQTQLINYGSAGLSHMMGYEVKFANRYNLYKMSHPIGQLLWDLPVLDSYHSAEQREYSRKIFEAYQSRSNYYYPLTVENYAAFQAEVAEVHKIFGLTSWQTLLDNYDGSLTLSDNLNKYQTLKASDDTILDNFKNTVGPRHEVNLSSKN